MIGRVLGEGSKLYPCTKTQTMHECGRHEGEHKGYRVWRKEGSEIRK